MHRLLLLCLILSSCSTLRDPRMGETIGEKGGGIFGGVVGDAAGNGMAGNMIGISLGGATGEALSKMFDAEAKLISEKLPDAKMTRARDSIKLELANTALFDANRTALSKQGSVSMTNLAEILKANETNTLKIRVYTNVRIQPLTLTRKRALAIAKFLEAKGIASQKINSTGMGRTKMTAGNLPGIELIITR